MTLIIEVLTGPPGNGKTHAMRRGAARLPGLYVFAYPQIKLLKEQTDNFLEEGLQTFLVHSKRAGDVQTQLSKALATIHQEGITHCAIQMTHAGLLSADLSGLTGFHWRIDEAIELQRCGSLDVQGADVASWKSRFGLLDASKGWSRAVGSKTKQSVQSRGAGPFGRYAAFAQAADQGVAFLSAEKWRPGRLGWLSFKSPLTFPNPASVQIAAAGFEKSLSYRLLRRLLDPSIEFRFRKIVRRRSRQPTVRVHYFATWEEASPHWETRDGRLDLKLISDWIRTNAPGLGYWAANDEAKKVMDWRISDIEAVSAKLPGLNKLDSCQSCAIVYSAKATKDDDILIDRFGITKEEIRIAREDDDIFQFIYRGAIRRHDYGGTYDIYLFSQQQAGRQVERLIESGLTDVEALHVPIERFPTARRQPPKKGRKKTHVEETPDGCRKRRSADRKRQRDKAKLSDE